MHKNPIWLAFLATIVLVVLWFSGTTSYEIYKYISFSAKTLPKKVNWSVWEKSNERYVLRAVYTYMAKGKLYTNETKFDHIPYRNRKAAQQKIVEFSQKKWMVWYNPLQPEQASIQKSFPLKSCVYTAILWGLLGYFIWLGFYVGKYRTYNIG